MRKSQPAESLPRLGRPRAFDTDAALERALQVFWRKGYEGTGLSDLTAAMRISRPSLYSAFGSKEALFRKALDRYESNQASFVRAALKQPAARAMAEELLQRSARVLTHPRHPHGCLMVQGALSCGEQSASIKQELIARRGASEAAIRKRLKRAKSEGDLPRHANPADLARFLVTVLHGMSVEATGGATLSQLQRVARTAMRAWPK
ncbi:MAG: TetR/AcrR family transcriptional regulator [Candidatus Acidiferrales bacterium]